MKKFSLVALLCILCTLQGCVKKPPIAAPTEPESVTTPTVEPNSSSDSTGMQTKFPNPGPFKVVTLKNSDGTIEELLQSRGDVGQRGGILRVSTFGTQGPKTFNPWVSSDVESSGIGLLMFERLVDIDPWTGQPYPRLAKSIAVSPDHLEYTFVLRKGLKWSDGKPITADDVVFTFDKVVKEGFGNSSHRDVISVYDEYPKVWKLDDLTIKFKTSRPFAPFLTAIQSIPIAPKHVIEPQTRKPVDEFPRLWNVDMDPQQMVVSGPFKLHRYLPSQRVELRRNPLYGMVDSKGERLPYLDQFHVNFVPDQGTMILKFIGNEIDFLDVRGVRGIDAAILKRQEKSGNFTMYNLGADDGTYFLMFNLNQRKNPKNGKFYLDPKKQKWFNNLHFRQAVSHAISRSQLVSNVLRGVGMPLFTAEPTSSLFYNSNLKGFPQDMELAKSLLEKGGFKLRNGDLYDADGNHIEFTLQTNAGNLTREGICNHIKDELKKLGIKVNFQPIDFNLLVAKTEDTLDWDAVVMALSGSRLEPYEGANVWKSNGRLHMFDQRLPNSKGTVVVNDARPWEKEIDRLFDLGATTFDPQKRKDCYWKYQEIVYEQQPYIYLVSILDLTAMRNTIGNYKPMPWGINYTPKGSLHNIEEIYAKAGGGKQ